MVTETFIVAWTRLESVPDRPADRLWSGTPRPGECWPTSAGAAGARRPGAAAGRRVPHRPGGTRAPPRTRLVAAAAFGRLAARDREVLSLAGWRAWARPRWPRCCGCSTNAARLSLHRARRRYDQLLTEARTPSGRSVPASGRIPAPGELRVGWPDDRVAPPVPWIGLPAALAVRDADCRGSPTGRWPPTWSATRPSVHRATPAAPHQQAGVHYWLVAGRRRGPR